MVLPLIASMMTFISGFGSLLAAWSAADAVASRDALGHGAGGAGAARCGAGNFCSASFSGVQLMMLVFVLIMLGLNYLLAWIGGATIQTTPVGAGGVSHGAVHDLQRAGNRCW